MQAIRIKPLCELSLTELFDAYGRIVWAQANCQAINEQFDVHAKSAEAIKAEIERREERQRHGAMFAPKAVNREPDGEILYA